MKQSTFASLSFESKKKPMRRERFLVEMEQVVPWESLPALIEPHYPRSGRRGRPPMAAATMLRIHFLQQWYCLSDPGVVSADRTAAFIKQAKTRQWAREPGLRTLP